MIPLGLAEAVGTLHDMSDANDTPRDANVSEGQHLRHSTSH